MKKLFILFLFSASGIIHAQKTQNAVQEKKQAEVVYTTADKAPEFPGGIPEMFKFVNTHLATDKFKGQNIKGIVYVKFTVGSNGVIRDILVLKDIPGCKLCDDEAIRVVSGMPKWNPAQIKGKAVSAYFNLPVEFNVR